MDPQITGALIQGAATILGAGGAILFAHTVTNTFEKQKHQVEKDLAFRQLFNDFNVRFDNLNGSLNEVLKLAKEEFAGNILPFDALSTLHQNSIQDYLNLCSEEFLWHRKKFIDEEIWLSWKIGLSYYLKVEPIAELFKRERDGLYAKSYYEGFFKEIADILPQ